MSILPIFIILIVGIGLYFLTVYNQLVTLKTRIKASIQEIGNQLKRQTDLIPNLVASAKGYLKHEQEIFTKLTEARKAVLEVLGSQDAQKIIDAGTRLQNALAPIRAVFESNPQLQAAGPTTQLMNELRDTADKVMYSRRTLIDLTADYNIKITVFPSNLVARLLQFKPEAGLTVEDAETELKVKPEDMLTPKVSL